MRLAVMVARAGDIIRWAVTYRLARAANSQAEFEAQTTSAPTPRGCTAAAAGPFFAQTLVRQERVFAQFILAL